MSHEIDFPEASEFLQKMKLKKRLMGYDTEDVMLAMHQLNCLYQNRLATVKEQMEQAAREEKEQLKQELREQIRMEERERLLEEAAEKEALHKKELSLLAEDLNRAAEQLQGLRRRVGQMTENPEKEKGTDHERDTEEL